MNTINSPMQRFFLKRKSQTYSAMTLILPLIVLVLQKGNLGSYALLVGALLVTAVIALPKYVAFTFRVEDLINLKLACVTPSRLVRIAFHVPLLIGICALVVSTGNPPDINATTLLILLGATNGLQGAGVMLAYKGHGDRMSNTLLSFSLSACVIAISLISSIGFYIAVLLALMFVAQITLGILSDLRARFYPKNGVGVFFGSFNPIHRTHLKIIKNAIESRGLKKVYIHSTTVPKLHRTALESGEIEMTQWAGMRVYKKTHLADSSKNYFPTGNKFYEYEIRKELLKASIVDAGLQGKVELLDLPHIYERSGFFGILDYVKQANRDVPIHGIHGSDVGGIWVRNIFDMSGWVYPIPVVRTDNISATAIREGAIGYTSTTVEEFLTAARLGENFVFPSGYVFENTKNFQSGKYKD